MGEIDVWGSTGVLDVLSVGRGHLRLTIEEGNAIDAAKAQRVIEDMLKRGFAIFVENADGTTSRVKRFSPRTFSYIIDDTLNTVPADQAPPVAEVAEAAGVPPLGAAAASRPRRKTKEVRSVPRGRPQWEGPPVGSTPARTRRRKQLKAARRTTMRARDLDRAATARAPKPDAAGNYDPNALFAALSDHKREWAGYPVPVSGMRLVMEDRYPGKATYEELADRRADVEPVRQGDGATIVNQWWSRVRQGQVILYRLAGEDRTRVVIDYRENKPGMRLTFWLSTLLASQGWDAEAEDRAMLKLKALVKPHVFDAYRLTGTFLETSPRSGVTYMFRRARPTVAIVPTVRGDEHSSMKILAVLCMHPIGLYDDTWAGAMVPTDDVVAHLLFMRGDEHGYWKVANQHQSRTAQAGL